MYVKRYRVVAAGVMLGVLLLAGLPATHAKPASSRPPDLNRDGYGDLAIGVPYENIDDVVDAGTVSVLYGAPGALSGDGNQYWHQDMGVEGVAESFDNFGIALAIGDLNGDGHGDLVVGVPGEDVGSVVGAGAINVLYGSAPDGLSPSQNQYITQADDGMDGSAEEDDYFGATLAIGDLNGDGYDDLAVGVPGEDVGSVVDAGAVHVMYGSSSGLSVPGNKAWYEDLMESQSEEGDACGAALASADFDGDGYDDLAVGIPRDDLIDVVNSGAVIVLWGGSTGLHTSIWNDYWHQDRSGITEGADAYDYFGHTLAAGDVNGDRYDDLIVGVPYEDVGSPAVVDAGYLHVLFGTSLGLAAPDEYWHQGSPDVSRALAEGDRFGWALTVGDFDGDGIGDLAIGIPYEDWVTDLVDSGIVQILYGTLDGLVAPDQVWHQDSSGIEGMDEAGDRFGYALASADFNADGWDDLAVGVPYEAVVVGGTSIDQAGLVNVLYGSDGGLAAAGDQLWYQGYGILGAPEVGDRFGYALAAAAGLERAYLPFVLRNVED